MAEVVIRLVVNRETGKKDVIVSYSSDADALPMEHEDMHRKIVDRLVEGGALAAADVGEVVVTRSSSEDAGSDASIGEPPEGSGEPVAEGG